MTSKIYVLSDDKLSFIKMIVNHLRNLFGYYCNYSYYCLKFLLRENYYYYYYYYFVEYKEIVAIINDLKEIMLIIVIIKL